jgi:hypothetical protein
MRTFLTSITVTLTEGLDAALVEAFAHAPPAQPYRTCSRTGPKRGAQ